MLFHVQDIKPPVRAQIHHDVIRLTDAFAFLLKSWPVGSQDDAQGMMYHFMRVIYT